MALSAVLVRVNLQEFSDTLRRYRQFSKRDNAIIVNTKAFYIARRATLETPKAQSAKIRSELLKQQVIAMKLLGRRIKITKRGIKAGSWITEKVKGAPLAALIINARRGRSGQKGLYGEKMTDAVNLLIAAKLRSVGFIKSGWLSAIKILEPLAERIRGQSAPRMDRSAKEYGAPKGDAIWARPGDVCRAVIENTASTTRDTKEALILYGAPALQAAFNAETQSMKDYIDRKMRETASAAGIKHN